MIIFTNKTFRSAAATRMFNVWIQRTAHRATLTSKWSAL